jgi:hypothetical protein
MKTWAKSKLWLWLLYRSTFLGTRDEKEAETLRDGNWREMRSCPGMQIQGFLKRVFFTLLAAQT